MFGLIHPNQTENNFIQSGKQEQLGKKKCKKNGLKNNYVCVRAKLLLKLSSFIDYGTSYVLRNQPLIKGTNNAIKMHFNVQEAMTVFNQ